MIFFQFFWIICNGGGFFINFTTWYFYERKGGLVNRYYHIVIFLFVLTLLSGHMSYARPQRNAEDSLVRESVVEKFAIYYKVDSIDINPTYLQNKQNIMHIKNYLQNSPRIDSITIYAWASPEGGYSRNLWLSKERAKTAKRFLLANSPDSLKLNSGRIKISPLAENWEGLEQIVVERYQRHDKEKVLKIIRDKSIGDETRKWRLQQLDKGYTWTYLKRRYMPELRTATWVCVWAEVITPLAELSPAKDTLRPALQSLPQLPFPKVEPEKEKTIYALRTNLLVPGLNVGAEMSLGTNWSVAADYYYPWFWPKKDNKNCFELLGWSVEGRYWFGRNRSSKDLLRGHSVGLYATAGYYDFERNFKGQQGEFIGTGLDYTYSMGIGREKKVNLAFTLAVGYLHSWGTNYTVPVEYGELYPEDGTVLFDYFGPTKAAVSIVIPICHKEGRR